MLAQSQTSPTNEDLELKASFALGAVAQLQNKKQLSTHYYSNCYRLQQGPVDYNAIAVEQREVGYSSQEKIGTSNIQQCVAVIIRDSETKKTALAHVDKFTNPDSLIKVMQQFPTDAKLDVKLVGGRDQSPDQKYVSDGNIAKVIDQLKQYPNVNVTSADIAGKKAPSAIVVNPETGEILNATPAKPDSTLAARSARLTLGGNELNLAFDFTQYKQIPKVSFNEEQQHNLFNLYKFCNSDNSFPGAMKSWKGSVVEPMNQVMEGVIKENQSIRKEFVEHFVSTEVDKKLSGVECNQSKKANLIRGLNEAILSNYDKKQLTMTDIQDTVNNHLDKAIYKRSLVGTVFKPINLWHRVSASIRGNEYMSIHNNMSVTLPEVIQKASKVKTDHPDITESLSTTLKPDKEKVHSKQHDLGNHKDTVSMKKRDSWVEKLGKSDTHQKLKSSFRESIKKQQKSGIGRWNISK